MLNLTYVAYKKKMHFSAKCIPGHIAIQWFHIRHDIDYQSTKKLYTSRCKIKCDFARYATKMLFGEISRNVSKQPERNSRDHDQQSESLGQFREIPWNQITDLHRASTLKTRVIT